MIMSICLGQLPLLAMVESDVKLLNLSSLNVLSYNCRGFNELKIPYIHSVTSVPQRCAVYSGTLVKRWPITYP